MDGLRPPSEPKSHQMDDETYLEHQLVLVVSAVMIIFVKVKEPKFHVDPEP